MYGILPKNAYENKKNLRSRKRIDQVPEYVDYFCEDDKEFPETISRLMEEHLNLQLRLEGAHVKTWAISQKFA